MKRKYILYIVASFCGLLLIYSGFNLYIDGGIYDFLFNILLWINNLSFLKGFDYIQLANKFFNVRFAPLTKLAGILFIINGIGIFYFIILSLLKNKNSILNKLYGIKLFANQNLHKYSIILIFLISIFILSLNFNGEIARINSFKQAEVASNISYYVNTGFTIEETLFNKNIDLKFFSYPFYQYLVATLCKISGMTVTQSGRLINIFFFAITFFLFLKLFNILKVNKSIQLISIFLFAFSPLVLYYYRSVHPDPMAIFFSFLSLYYYLKYEKKSGNNKFNYFIIIISGVIATLIKSPIYLLIILAIFFYRLQIQNLRSIFKKDFIIYAIIIASTVVFYKITADIINEGAVIKASWMFATLNLRLSITPYILLFTWYFIEVLTPILFLFFIYGIYNILKLKTKNSGKVVFSSLFYGMIITILIFFNVFRAHDYYQLPFIIIVAYFTSIPINKFFDRYKHNKSVYAYSVFQFVIIVLISFAIFKMPTNPDFNVIRSAKFIQKNTDNKDFVFYIYDKNIQNWDPTYLFHTQREGFNLALNNLSKDNYVDSLITKYKNNHNNFYVFIPKQFINDLNSEQLQVHLKPFKRNDTGIIYKIN